MKPWFIKKKDDENIEGVPYVPLLKCSGGSYKPSEQGLLSGLQPEQHPLKNTWQTTSEAKLKPVGEKNLDSIAQRLSSATSSIFYDKTSASSASLRTQTTKKSLRKATSCRQRISTEARNKVNEKNEKSFAAEPQSITLPSLSRFPTNDEIREIKLSNEEIITTDKSELNVVDSIDVSSAMAATSEISKTSDNTKQLEDLAVSYEAPTVVAGTVANSLDAANTTNNTNAQLDYIKRLENEYALLQNSYLTLTAQYSRMQFRVRQILQAPPEDRDQLITELEKVSKTHPYDFQIDDQLPNKSPDHKFMGNVRNHQSTIIQNLRGQLLELNEKTVSMMYVNSQNSATGSLSSIRNFPNI